MPRLARAAPQLKAASRVDPGHRFELADIAASRRSSGRQVATSHPGDASEREADVRGGEVMRMATPSPFAAAATALEGRACIGGQHIRFGEGAHAPDTGVGLHLLAHDLVHVASMPASGVGPRIFRQAAPARAGAPAVDQRDPETFAALLEALDRIGEVRTSETFSLEMRGRTFPVTSEQVLQLRQTAIREIGRAASRARISADGDLEGYRYQQQINQDSWIVAPIVHFVGGIRDPGPELTTTVSQVQAADRDVRAALSDSRLADALRALMTAERASRDAHRLWREYNEGVISSAEGTASALTFTRDASFITLGVLAIVATGGAATTTVLGLEVGTTTAATAVSVGAPLVARVGEAGVRAGLGEQVDWARVAVDTVVDLVIMRLGGRLGQGLFQRLGGNPAVRRLGPDLARRVLSSVVMHEGATALRVIIDATYRRIRGQAITWEQFGEALLTQMTDPRGIFIAVVMGAVQTAADRRHGTPREFDVRDQQGRPVADIDEMRGGTLYEDKNASRLYVIPPGQTRPQQTEAEWAVRQIYEPTVRRISGIPTRATSTDRGRQSGSTRSVPDLSDVQASRRYVFRIELDNPALRSAVQAQLARLRAQFPDWTFDAIFGYRPIRQ
jgi:hypothetical protein